jgi:uncharacterized membrane protein
MTNVLVAHTKITSVKSKRVQSIDLLRGTVMVIMALDHVRIFFHHDAYRFSPTDLSQTNIPLFFTRLITHYCAPVFVFLAGVSAFLYGHKRTQKELSFFLFSRGIWLVLVEAFIISLETSFNPTYPYTNLQVIWAIGISMIVLSVLIYLGKKYVLIVGLVLIAGHNLLDNLHATPGTVWEVVWSVLHEPREYVFGGHIFYVRYPVLPWIGIISVGYYIGHLYTPDYDAKKRVRFLLWSGWTAIELFLLLRAFNLYGDPAPWSVQKNTAFTVLSFFNVTKYPPSLLYTLMTLGPAVFFLALTEKPLHRCALHISLYGRVPFFYYILHFFLIHLFALIAAVISGSHWTDMILSTSVNKSPALKGFGFNLLTVYSVWITIVLMLFPLCAWFDRYKRKHQATQKWLSYL